MVALTERSDRQLEELVGALGGRAFQARQLAQWIYRHGAADYSACRNLPRALCEALRAEAPLVGSEVVLAEQSQDGTEKLLLRLTDGQSIEAVLIPEQDRTTLCISTQVGCPVGCIFCASGLGGVRRNLTSGEIIEQVLHARRRLPAGRPLTNLVVMGMGEPLLNMEALLVALERIHDPAGINLGARRITVSTSGYPERMRRFAKAPFAYNLAVSLHAADDALRQRLVPTARATVRDIVAAARDVFESKHREVTFEVVLLADINDGLEHARRLVEVLDGLPCTVNLIPWNPVAEIAGLRRPADSRVAAFASCLSRGGLKVTVRKQRGADRSAACGQLRIRAAGAPS